MRYTDKLKKRLAITGSNLCVGLDPRPDQTEGDLEAFLQRVVEETAPFAAAFKPNMAYFEALGLEGIALLERLLKNMPREVPVILDAKRSDIGETQKYYARAYFETWGVDAVTLNPFLGYDTIEPFLGYAEKGVYLLAVTSNPGSADIEMLKTEDGRYVFEQVQSFASRAADAAALCDVGLVVGLTNAQPDVLGRIHDLPLLVPGLGAQGGDLAALAQEEREAPSVINVSRGILYAEPRKSFSEKAEDYAEKIRSALGRD